ncbi:cyclic nucleotide-binding domain protein (macronuclear) [Tetrahymena thermophila SB210]|uniref:Cyclic nucleotide-binding domain protein n=1 Tax=Tetrahymena thermophila (strain SB210) TaxID=312017 RepID=Q245V9_TETTS|nr:cyclic nucleotide-binding domain protein [Tetrahymena thermophila SB210]EAS03524.2 cyclic nucleotide-binding domain protein [Tetrahymena thermophila SB210]|eukprot:XP_001023769.2 cyclic nucleotide-binding domain protein [Tetrahymena thermophila SB210]
MNKPLNAQNGIDSSNISINNKVNTTKKDQSEDQLNYSAPLDQLFHKQRHYIQSDEVQALQSIHLKKESFLSESDAEILSYKGSKEFQTSNLVLQNGGHNNGSSIIEVQNNTNNNTPNNNHYEIKAPIQFQNLPQKMLFDKKRQKSILRNGDDKLNFSFDIDQNSIVNSPNPTHIKSKYDKSPEKLTTFKNLQINEDPLDESGQEFLKAVAGFGNIFRFYGIIQPKIKRFFYTKTYAGKLRHLTLPVRRTVNDSADYVHQETNRSCIRQFVFNVISFIEKVCYFLKLNKIPIINPENKLKILFNTIIVTYNCFYLFLRSLQIFFHADLGDYSHYFHYAAEAAWVTEMLVQLNTSMYYHNHFTKDRKIIFQIYCSEYFFFEVLPLIFDGKTSEYKLLEIFFLLTLLLKIKGIMIILKNLEFYILQILDNHSFFQLLKLILQMILFGHVLACAQSVIISYEINYNNNDSYWQTQYEYNYKDWITLYLQSLYWSFTIVMSMQYNPPQSDLEIVFTCICMLVSCAGFGYLINSIGSILGEINKEQEDYKKDLNILNQFMKRKKIEISLMRRANIQLKKYYEQQKRVRYNQENETLVKLNEYMMKELLISSNLKIIKRYPLFNLFTQQTLFKICTKMQEKLYAPSQIIFDRKVEEKDDYFLYLLVNGSVMIEDKFKLNVNEDKKDQNKYYFIDDNKTFYDQAEEEEEKEHNEKVVGRKLQKGEFFGVTGFFTGKEVMSKAISQDFSTVMIISKSDFEKILQEEKKDFEKFKEVADKIQLYHDYSDLRAHCDYCQSKFHYTDQCSKVYFDKDPYFVIKKMNFSQTQQRKQAVRESTKFNSIVNILFVKNSTLDYKVRNQDDLTDFLSEYTQSDQDYSDNELDDQVETIRDTQKQKTYIHKEESRVQNDGLFDDRDYKQELIKTESKFDIGQNYMDGINPIVLQQGQVPPNNHSEDDSIYYDQKQNYKNYIGSEKDAINKELEMQQDRGSYQTIQNTIPNSMKRGSIDGTIFNNRSQVQTISVGKNEYLLKQLLNGVQDLISQLNTRGSSKRKQSTNVSNIGSNLEISSKIQNIPSNLKNPGIDNFKPAKQSNFDEYTHSISRKSIMRHTFRSTSYVTSKKDRSQPQQDYYKEMSFKSKLQSNQFSYENNFIWDIDRMQDYENYFPHQNASEILKKFTNYQTKSNKKRKSKRQKGNGQSIKRTQTQNTKNKDRQSLKIFL